MIDTLLSVKEFATILRIHPSTVRRAIIYGRIHAFRVGIGLKASFRIPKSEVERMMAFDLTSLIEKRAKELNSSKNKSEITHDKGLPTI